VARPVVAERNVRAPAVAGSFYPADPARLAATVDHLLAEAGSVRLDRPLRAIVVPHAGYLYSGAVAAASWAAVRAMTPMAARVVLAGPAHFVPLHGACVPAATRWRVPTGEVEIDDDLRALAEAAGARSDDRPHEPEHSLEVQLPFLLRVAGAGVRALPVAVGEMGRGPAAELLERLVEESDLLVVSTDLSHYHDDATARRLDRGTVEAIVARDPAAIGDLAACGVFALRGLVELAARRGWHARLLDRRTSADAGGDFDRVVGYAAIAFGQGADAARGSAGPVALGAGPAARGPGLLRGGDATGRARHPPRSRR
jgi:MEMO1 family protein